MFRRPKASAGAAEVKEKAMRVAKRTLVLSIILFGAGACNQRNGPDQMLAVAYAEPGNAAATSGNDMNQVGWPPEPTQQDRPSTSDVQGASEGDNDVVAPKGQPKPKKANPR